MLIGVASDNLTPGARLTHKPTRSPRTASGTGTAHASLTRSSAETALSTSAEGTFSPPRMMMSFAGEVSFTVPNEAKQDLVFLPGRIDAYLGR